MWAWQLHTVGGSTSPTCASSSGKHQGAKTKSIDVVSWHDMMCQLFIKEVCERNGNASQVSFPLHVENGSEDAEFIFMQVQESRPPRHQDNGWDSSVSSDTWTLPVVAVAMQQTNSGLFGCCFETMVTLCQRKETKKWTSLHVSYCFSIE